MNELLIERIARRCRELGIAYLPVVIPFHARVGDWQSFAAAQPHPAMIEDYPEQRLGRLFERLGVPAVMMKEVFEENTAVFFPLRGGHLNPAAHRLTARTIYEALRQAGLTGGEAAPLPSDGETGIGETPVVIFFAEPNPIPVCERSGLGMTTLTWDASGKTRVEIRIGSPDGELLARRGPQAWAETGKWVTDGMKFYLQDASGDRSTAGENTLATLTVEITDEGCR